MKNYLKNIYNLVKQDIKTDTSFGNSDNKTLLKKIFKYIGIIILIAYIVFFGYVLSKDTLEGLGKLGLQNYFIIGIVIISYILVFFTSMRSLISNKNKDNTEKYIDKLPVTSKQRYISKNLTQIIYSYSSIAMICLIPLIYYGVVRGESIFYFLRTLFSILMLPILPTIILFAIMTAIKTVLDILTKGKTENLVSVITLVLIIYIYYLIYYKFQSQGNGINTFINLISGAKENPLMYIPMLSANIIIGKNVLLNMLILIGINIFSLIVFTAIFGNIYRVKKGALGDLFEKVSFINKNKSKTKNEKEKQKLDKEEKNIIKDEKESEIWEKLNLKDKDFKQKSKAFTYIKREYKFFSSNLMLALNTFLLPIFMPVFIIIISIFSMSGMFERVKNNRSEMYLEVSNNLSDLASIENKKKEGENTTDEVLKEAYSNIVKYNFATKDGIIENLKRNKKDEEANLSIALEMLESKIKEAEKEKKLEEKENLKLLKEQIISNQKQIENVDSIDEEEVLKNTIAKFSFENIDEDKEKEIFKKLTKLKEEGKIISISEEEKKEQEEDEKYKKYAKYELPTQLLSDYIETKEITNSDSFISFGISKINNVRGKYEYTSIPKEAQFLIPVGVIAFLMYSMQLSIFMFSKEKNEITFLKTIPLKYNRQIKYKQIPGILAALISALIYFIIPEIVLSVKMYKSIYFIAGFILGLVIILLFNNIEIILDLTNPNFKWKDTTALAKSSTNIFVLFIIKTAIFGLIGYLGYLLVWKNKIISFNNYLIYSSIFIILLATIVEIIILKIGPKMFKKLSN